MSREKVKGKIEYIPPFQLVSRPELEKAIRMSRSKIYDVMNEKSPAYDQSFPKPLKIGSGRASSVFWRADEITEWMNNLQRT